MGKSIDLTQPLSDEDRAWLEERGAIGDLRIADELAAVAAGTLDPVAVEEIPAEEDEDDEEHESESYGGWTKAQLQYELSTRDLPQYGTKAELIDRLETADAAAVEDDGQS